MTFNHHFHSDIVERIYSTAIDPNGYDSFMELWDAYLQDDPEARSEDLNAGLGAHFEIAFRILEDQGRGSKDTLFGGERLSVRPALLLNRAGQVVWSNDAAMRLFQLGLRPMLADLAILPEDAPALQAIMESLDNDTAAPRPALVKAVHPADGRLHVLVGSLRAEPNGEKLVLLEDVHGTWPDGAHRLLDSFGLSAAEKDIAALLYEGHNTEGIADSRNSSVATVRTQVKRILSKTTRHSQADLLRLLGALARLAEAQTSPDPQDDPALQMTDLGDDQMYYYDFGPAQGRPVVMFHGMLDGFHLTDTMLQLLHRHQIRLYAPLRPCFGAAPDDGGDIPQAPERFAERLHRWLAHLQPGPVVLLGHMAGSLYAHAAARRLGADAAGIVIVSGGVPILSSRQFASMSPRQRIVAHTARFTPGLLKFVLRAGIRQIDHGGIRNFMQSLYAEGTPDWTALQDTSTYDSVKRGYLFTVAQGHRGFEIDSYHVVRDWSDLVEGHSLPMTLLHGAEDPVVSRASVADFARLYHNRADLRVLEGTGQLVFYSRAQEVVRALSAAFDPHGAATSAPL